MDLQQHPLSAAFPSMPADELDALAEDIQKNGQREPGVIYEGMVLDGWHRYRACEKAEIPFRSVEFDGDDPIAFVLSKNLLRRHLSASQRAAAIVATHNWRPLGYQKGMVGKTTDHLAKSAEVSEKTIRQAKEAERAGLGKEVREGVLSAERAAAIAKLPPKKREKAVEAVRAGEEPALPKPRAVIASREVEKLYERVKAELIDVQGKYADLLEKNVDLADTARELNDRLEAFEAAEPDEQQKLIMELQKKLQRKDGEIARLTAERNRLNDKCNQLIRQVKSLQKAAK